MENMQKYEKVSLAFGQIMRLKYASMLHWIIKLQKNKETFNWEICQGKRSSLSCPFSIVMMK